uniref:Protein kinase domain-containing protein n=2 Tax=Physcomitrium patens TaxID=3218 RepID=A0A7I4BMH5_PHYPA
MRLFLSGNAFSGSIKFETGSKLVVVDLSDNSFSGSIESPLPESDLLEMNLSGNEFSGRIPQELFQKTTLKTLDLSRNKFGGPIPAVQVMVSLTTLKLSDNMLEGQIPPELFNEQTPQLREVDLSRNQLSGGLGLVTTKVMSVLRLASNSMTGPLPSKIQSCSVVDLSDNHFSGSMSLSKWSANLRALNLSHNNLSGTIDNASLVQMFALNVLDLSFNQLSGSIPPQFLASPSITELVLSHNQFEGSILNSLPSTSSPLNVLDLSSNHLSGAIPDALGSYSKLLVLSLSTNHLEGTIPGRFSNLVQLQILDLSKNSLTGSIPSRLSLQLKSFNVSGNNLSGTVPSNLAGFSTSSFYPGNPNLLLPHAPSSHDPGSGVQVSLGSSHKRVNLAVKVGLIVGITLGAVLIAALCLIIYFRKTLRPSMKLPIAQSIEQGTKPKADAGEAVEQPGVPSSISRGSVKGTLAPPKARSDIKRDALDLQKSGESPMRTKWRTAGAPSDDDASVSSEHPMVLKVKSPDRLAGDLFFLDATLLFTAEELSRAPAEVLGRSNHGTSYKATLDNGHILTVKWLREGLARNKKEFTREAKRFSGVKHPNVVSLRGYYWGPREHEKLLLSDFISRGSLAHHLYENSERKQPPLTWDQRLQIAVGVASGLSYLHNKHGVPHGNLKANNILLQGPELTARVSDYSLHRLMTVAGTANQILNAGVLGYRSPELVATRKPKPSLASDVYALGVILLELLTGKGAGDIMSANSGAVDLPDWVRVAVKECRPVDCFDAVLVGLHREQEPPKSMYEVLDIAFSCMTPQATRPTLKCILDQLVALANA